MSAGRDGLEMERAPAHSLTIMSRSAEQSSPLALAVVGYDGPTAMKILERPRREPSSGQVRIGVSHAGMGFIDALFSTGFGRVELPFIPGLEVVGTVTGVGEGVGTVSRGDSVAALTMPGGGFSQEVIVDSRLVVPLPPGLSAATAAATCTNTTTAVSALARVDALSDAAVLVHAGAGGLGSQFGQVARLLGASRTGAVVGSQAKARCAAALGYDDVYLRDDLDRVPEHAWDVVVDPVGGEATRMAARHLAQFGTLLCVGNASGAPAVDIDSLGLWLTATTASGFNLGALAAANPEAVGADLHRALTLVASDRVRVDVTRRVSLEEARSALADLLAGGTTGKTVITF